tara:strand:- start:298 stop:408 length:111 start_codon:yes stop_codon:yes gene_type:complete
MIGSVESEMDRVERQRSEEWRVFDYSSLPALVGEIL